MKQWYEYFCDRCQTKVYDDRPGYREHPNQPLPITEKTRKGKTLHFCSEECCRLIRGVQSGKNREFDPNPENMQKIMRKRWYDYEVTMKKEGRPMLVCIREDTDLTVGKEYRQMKIRGDWVESWARVIDDSGEDYLHPKSCFREKELIDPNLETSKDV